MAVLLVPGVTAFPPLRFASREGLVAIGGDLSRARLLEAYRCGIFPWYDELSPILWWSPPERCILPPETLHTPRSLVRTLRRRRFTVTCDTAFASVISACASVERQGRKGTWIVPELLAAYCDLHEAGYAHSVETWEDGELAGGLYGVALGGAFFGESMFYVRPDASKVAMVWLTRFLQFRGFPLIDCQQTTDNLLRFGALPVSRGEFMKRLHVALALPCAPGPWKMPEGFSPL